MHLCAPDTLGSAAAGAHWGSRLAAPGVVRFIPRPYRRPEEPIGEKLRSCGGVSARTVRRALAQGFQGVA